jgi:endogenous inhibitor of DNA gyrase (YacG/DUF329 family)
MIGVYAIPPGVPVAVMKRLGWSNPEPPPVPGCVLVLIASDSEGLFGHQCPRCRGYWRAGPFPDFCPYCALNADSLDFLSEAQHRYIQHYCEVLAGALAKGSGQAAIDMDAVADAASKTEDRPAFYVSEESQQHKFKCAACGAFNDIIGTYGFCSQCVTRNDLAVLEATTMPKLRERLNGGGSPEDCIRDAVAAMDSFIGQYATQLAQLVPMVTPRKHRLTTGRFHDFDEVTTLFREWFGFDLLRGVKSAEADFAKRMFHRRHVYEHKGGEADEKYIKDSGDAVRLKQRLHNTKEESHNLIGILLRVAGNLHSGFHELIPPAEAPIVAWQERQTRAG